ncbi:MAG: hypothetical protein ACTS10_03250 [Kiloniellales bacterium]
MGAWKAGRWLGGAVFGGLMAAAVAASAQSNGDLPEVEAPDFANAREVIASLEEMKSSIEEVKEAKGWRALRAFDQCETAIDIIEDKITAAAYDAEAGERSWGLCHHRYWTLSLH